MVNLASTTMEPGKFWSRCSEFRRKCSRPGSCLTRLQKRWAKPLLPPCRQLEPLFCSRSYCLLFRNSLPSAILQVMKQAVRGLSKVSLDNRTSSSLITSSLVTTKQRQSTPTCLQRDLHLNRTPGSIGDFGSSPDRRIEERRACLCSRHRRWSHHSSGSLWTSHWFWLYNSRFVHSFCLLQNRWTVKRREQKTAELKIKFHQNPNRIWISELKSKQNPKGIWAEPINESCSDEFVRSSGQHSSG